MFTYPKSTSRARCYIQRWRRGRLSFPREEFQTLKLSAHMGIGRQPASRWALV